MFESNVASGDLIGVLKSRDTANYDYYLPRITDRDAKNSYILCRGKKN